MNRVYYNLNESLYKFNYGDYTFIFSSQFYLDNFERKHIDFCKCERKKLEQKFNSKIECDIVLLIDLYRKIEKRGFLIKYKNEELKIKDYLFTVKLND